MPIEPLEARWIKSPYGLYGVTWQCSYCWHATTFLMGDVESEDVLQFCPKCGAAMTEEADKARAQEEGDILRIGSPSGIEELRKYAAKPRNKGVTEELENKKEAERLKIWHYLPEVPDFGGVGCSASLLICCESEDEGYVVCIGRYEVREASNDHPEQLEARWMVNDPAAGESKAIGYTQQIERWAYYSDVVRAIAFAEGGRLIV